MRKEWLEKDYYSTLGVEKDASDKAIKKAFRKLAQQYHPDANPGDATAEARFKDINEAYEVLGDTETRSEYDRVRDMGYFVGGPGGIGDQQYVRVEDLFGAGGAGGSPFDLFGGLGDLFGRQQAATRQRPGRVGTPTYSCRASCRWESTASAVTVPAAGTRRAAPRPMWSTQPTSALNNRLKCACNAITRQQLFACRTLCAGLRERSTATSRASR